MKFIPTEPDPTTVETSLSEDGKWKMEKKHSFYSDGDPLYSIMSEPFLIISIHGSERTVKGAMRDCISKMRKARSKFSEAIDRLEAAIKEDDEADHVDQRCTEPLGKDEPEDAR